MENFNNNFSFDFSEAVIIKERINNLKIGKVRSASYREKPSVIGYDDGEFFKLDFVLPLPDGSLNVDDEMSDTSMNPVSNATVKSYIDEKSNYTKIFADSTGKASYSYNGNFTDFDCLICYATPTSGNSPVCSCIPIKYCKDVKSPMELQVADNESYTVFMFHETGFYTEKYSGSAGGKVLALYGVKG